MRRLYGGRSPEIEAAFITKVHRVFDAAQFIIGSRNFSFLLYTLL